MTNSLTSNVTRKLMRAFIPAFEKQRVLSKTVDTQTFQGEFSPKSGETVDIKRSHQFLAKRTSDGDMTSETKNSLISGKATATVQDWITVPVDFTSHEESLQLDQLEKILMPAATACVTELETSLADYMISHSSLSIGTPGTAVDAWTDVASAGSLMSALGVPGKKYYVMNPFVQQSLSVAQTGLSADPSRLVQIAWETAQISKSFAGLNVISSNSLSNWTRGTSADSAGALASAPTQTYLSVKDTMIQTWAVTGFSNNATIKAGDILEVTGKYAVHPLTRKVIFDQAMAAVEYRVVVAADVTLDGSGEGNVTVYNAAIFEANGQYNNISAALAGSDVITLLGASATVFQPAHFYSEDAFGIAFVKLKKLFATDTIATTSDGITLRVTKYADGLTNTNSVRIDLLPAFATFKPDYAGKGFGL